MSMKIYVPTPATPDGGFPDSKDAMGLARIFIATHGLAFYLHQDGWWLWDEAKYIPIGHRRLEGELWKWIEASGMFSPTSSVVRNTMKALAAICQTPVGTEMPCWLGAGDHPHPEGVIAFSNGLFVVDESRLIPHDPVWFSANCLPYPYDPTSECPAWERFLDEVFEGDFERVRALAQWFGYNLTRDTRQHTFAMLVGPPATGKSTTLRVLGDMLGSENVATPNFTTLWRFYGLETIHTKMAALVGDAHPENPSKAVAIMERLKSIVGGDHQNVDLKGRRELANVVIKARFTVALNELPQFPDTANALRRRMLVIPFHRSFQGREDRSLDDRLAAEMPGIVVWSMRGLEDLRRSGSFLKPKAGEAILDDFDQLGSPIREYIEDCCEVSPDYAIRCQTLWESWVGWCQAHGYRATNSGQFGAMLKAAEPNIDRVRHGRDDRGNQVRFYQGVTLRKLVALTSV